MKKIICLLGHNKHLMKINECTKEDFENENKEIRIYTCKYCDKVIFVRTRFVKSHFQNPNKEIHFENCDDLF